MVVKLCIIICIFGLKVCFCQRRIIHGTVSPQGKRFMVYLLNSRFSSVQPDAWLCGGAVISDTRILTSAACLTEVEYIYAIAGYSKYVSGLDINEDECTRTRKQKIVEIIVPQAFKENKVLKPDIWMKFDAGVGVVEKPYNFYDLSYRVVCSYEPASIMINYDTNLEQPNTIATVYGWGGTKARKPGETKDINSEYLRGARTVITNTTFCANYVSEELKNIVNESLICAFGSDYVTSNDKETDSDESAVNNCKTRRFSLNESNFDECNEDDSLLFRNRHSKKELSFRSDPDTRRANPDKNNGGGICENDHGGPLTSWIGASEVIIGIALTSVYNVKYECQGPYLYVGTARSASLIHCLLAQTNETRALCQYLNNHVHTTKINWPKEIDNSTNPRRQQLSKKQVDDQLQDQTLNKMTPEPSEQDILIRPILRKLQQKMSSVKVPSEEKQQQSSRQLVSEPDLEQIPIRPVSQQWQDSAKKINVLKKEYSDDEEDGDARVAIRPQLEIGESDK